jgi:hypothetical protein
VIDDAGRRASSTLRLICYPHGDDSVPDRVMNVVEELSRLGLAVTPEQVVEELRAWYPDIVISIREPLADQWGSQDPTWYVYRDGSILPGRSADATSA